MLIGVVIAAGAAARAFERRRVRRGVEATTGVAMVCFATVLAFEH